MITNIIVGVVIVVLVYCFGWLLSAGWYADAYYASDGESFRYGFWWPFRLVRGIYRAFKSSWLEFKES